MKVLLIPWVKSLYFFLRIYYEEPKHPCTEGFVEIRTFKGQIIATKLVQKYAASLKLSTFSVGRCLRMAVEAELPDATAEELLFLLKKIGQIPYGWKIPDKLAEDPTIEGVSRFLSIKKLLGGI